MEWMTRNNGKGRVKKSASSKFHSSINHQNVNRNVRDNTRGVQADGTQVSGWQWARNRRPLDNHAPIRSSGYVLNIDEYLVNNAKKKRKKNRRQQRAKRQDSVSSIKGRYTSKNQKTIINSHNEELKVNDKPYDFLFLDDLKFPSSLEGEPQDSYFIDDGSLDGDRYPGKGFNEVPDISELWRNINNNIGSKETCDPSLEQNSVMQIFLLSQYFYENVMFSDSDFPELTANQQGSKGRSRELKGHPANEERLANTNIQAGQWVERNLTCEQPASEEELETEDSGQLRELESFFTVILNDLGNDFLTDQDLECDSSRRFQKNIHSLYYSTP